VSPPLAYCVSHRTSLDEGSCCSPVSLQVASYMRAVLKTIAQCHAHNILHRDVKPGNFMLASEAEDARIKAIDFGLAVTYREGDDLSELDMQGTPWCAPTVPPCCSTFGVDWYLPRALLS
jgi:serine/threonine protein kinase